MCVIIIVFQILYCIKALPNTQ